MMRERAIQVHSHRGPYLEFVGGFCAEVDRYYATILMDTQLYTAHLSVNL